MKNISSQPLEVQSLSQSFSLIHFSLSLSLSFFLTHSLLSISHSRLSLSLSHSLTLSFSLSFHRQLSLPELVAMTTIINTSGMVMQNE